MSWSLQIISLNMLWLSQPPIRQSGLQLGLSSMLSLFIMEDRKHNWKRFVPQLVHAYNCTRHHTTGFSPFYMMFERQPRPRLAVGVLLNLKSSKYEKPCSSEYMKDLQKSLKSTYQIAQEAMKKTSRRANGHCDLRV